MLKNRNESKKPEEQVQSVGACFRKYVIEKPHKIILLFLLIFVVTVATLLPPQILKYIVDDVLLGGKEDKLIFSALLYTGAFLLLGVLQFLQEILLVSISQGICRSLRVGMMKKVHRLSYRTLVKHDTAALESYFNNDVGTIDTLITAGAISMIIDLFKMVGIFASIFFYNWQFGLMVSVFLPFLIWFAMTVRKKMFRAQMKNRNQEQEVNRLVLENVENMQAIKNYGCEDWTQVKYNRILEKHFLASKATNFLDGIFSPVMETIKFIVIIILLAFAGSGTFHFSISTGAIVAVITLLIDLFEPIENLGQELQTIQRSLSGLQRLRDFFKLEEDVHEEGQPIQEQKEEPGQDKAKLRNSEDMPTAPGSEPVLEFRNVSFAYEESEMVIKNLNLKVTGKERVVLSGRSGVGKSTIFKLAYGILKPTEGEVLLNGKSVFDMGQEERAGSFGLVYQEPFFSGGTIYEELTLSRKISEERVMQVLKSVGLSRITDIHKPLLERDFSSGELSMLNIARMLLTDCKIVFLDEMNARIDPVTAEAIMKIMDEVTQDKMVFSINHYGESLKNSRVIQL